MSEIKAIEVRGLKQSLRLLNRLAPAMRKEIGRDFRTLARPAAKQAELIRAKGKTVRGFEHQGRTGVDAWKSIAVKVDTRKARKRNAAKGVEFESLGVVKVLTKDAASAIMDMAGRVGNVQMSGRSRPYPGRPEGHALNGQGGFMIRKLNDTYGKSGSRFMWPGAEAGLAGTEDAFRDIVRKVERELQKALGNDYFGIAESEGF